MNLAGQAGTPRRSESGYAMAALLVALAVMAIMMSVAMPVWKQAAQREKEEELVFRGQQYVHALALFSRKYASASPPNFDVLVDQRFLRKKFKDPITNDDFQPILAGGAVRGTAGAPGQQGGATQPGAAGRGMTTFSTSPTGPSTAPTTAAGRGTSPTGAPGSPGAGGIGGIIGVTSKSKDKSIRLYNGRGHYNEWAFVFTQQTQAPGVGAPGTAAPGQRGQRGQPQRGPGGTTFTPTGPGRGDGRGRGGPGGGRGLGPGVNPFPPAQPILPPPRGRSDR